MAYEMSMAVWLVGGWELGLCINYSALGSNGEFPTTDY
jgi:hypothetical protein